MKQYEMDIPTLCAAVGIKEIWWRGMGKGVSVALLDLGTARHQDLRINMQNWGEHSPHATHVAGIIERCAPLCTLAQHPFSGASLDRFQKSFAAAVEHCNDVICIPCGLYSDSAKQHPVWQELTRAVWQRGIVLIAAAGNDPSNYEGVPFPACHPDVIAVHAIDGDFNRATFSPYGNGSAKVAMPGVSIYSTLGPTYEYGEKTGTSQASGILAGMVAAILSVYRPPYYSRVQCVRSILARIMVKSDDGAYHVPDGSMLYKTKEQPTNA